MSAVGKFPSPLCSGGAQPQHGAGSSVCYPGSGEEWGKERLKSSGVLPAKSASMQLPDPQELVFGNHHGAEAVQCSQLI